ncbi:MAG: IS110 family transposase [Chlorobiaceae bacterium]|nr:IS110 family transposase [Chlorobiaceae bacterium]
MQHDALVVQVSGNAVVHNRQLLDNRWDKHDRKDAANIADLISTGKCLFYDYPTQSIHDLRKLMSLRRRYRKLEAGLQTRIRNNLLSLFFSGAGPSVCFVPAGLSEHHQNLLFARVIASMPFEEFYRCFFKPRRKKQREFLEEIWNDAHQTIGRPVDESVQFMAEQSVSQLEQFRTEIAHLDRQILTIASSLPEYQYVISIPGFGPFITAKIIAAINDPGRFSNEAQLIKLAGFDLCASRSGQPSGKAVPKISKKGNTELRFALYQATMVATTKKPLFISCMNKKIQGREQEKGIKKIVRTKLATKFLVIAWTLMKEHQYFNAERLMLT